jgi:uncharacterized protein YecE (DUF72 family)
VSGSLFVGTSGFAYPDWAPRFYPVDLRDRDFLRHYATRFRAVELNGTFYARPTERAIAGWVAAVSPDFRFVVKAQRGSAVRALTRSPEEGVAWLTTTLGAFGERLAAVLFRVPAELRRDGPALGGDPAVGDARLRALLAAWPASIPLVLEFQHPSWAADETHAALREAGATLCATELPEDSTPPTIRRTGPRLYLRLRRHDYTSAELDAWADRLVPFLEAGDDAFVFFRHDPVGRATELAEDLRTRVAARRA